MKINFIAILICLIFSPIAAAMAFLITYEEYSHHFTDKKKTLKIAFEAAIFTLMIFGILSLLVSLFTF
jgi:tetrahydromethanopterin S-methyltransferase subunit C